SESAARGRRQWAASVGGGVRLADLGADPAAFGDLVAVLPRPLPNVGRRGATTGRLRPLCGALPADSARLGNILGEGVAKLARVLRGKVDLVRRAVQAKLDSLIGVTTVKIVDKQNLDLLGHQFAPFNGSRHISEGPPMTTIYSVRDSGNKIDSRIPTPIN